MQRWLGWGTVGLAFATAGAFAAMWSYPAYEGLLVPLVVLTSCAFGFALFAYLIMRAINSD